MREGKLAVGQNTTARVDHHSVNAERCSPIQFQDMWFLEKLAQFDRETSTSHRKGKVGSSPHVPEK
ncbi:catalase [Pectobacterium zantedeschiae]|uniref:catalase n=1 Tax=Pectobacterium zantedeschiae TaxID=2034769 RepID=UPI00101D38F1|nr:catalase [Pectobacterium zantedeschiae]RYC47640.1 catalase [Pectobacterium zantedeschiae]